MIDQNFGGTNGIYWNNYTINTPLTIPILRIPTAIRFARLNKENKEPVIHLIPVSDDFSVFPRIKIPMYLFKKAPGYSKYFEICDAISTHYRQIMDALVNKDDAPLNPNVIMKRLNP